jgi:hypothetical protein
VGDLLGTAGTEIAKAGILGAAVVALAFCVYVLWKDSRKSQKEFLDQLVALQAQRVNDAVVVRDQLLGVIKECTTAIATATRAMEAQKEATEQLERSFAMMDELRRSRR